MLISLATASALIHSLIPTRISYVLQCPLSRVCIQLLIQIPSIYNLYFSLLCYYRGKKPLTELDANFLLSPGHPDLPRRLEKTRVTTRRLSPLDLCDAIVKHKLDTPTKFQAFAKRQRLEGDETWVTWCMKEGVRHHERMTRTNPAC